MVRHRYMMLGGLASLVLVIWLSIFFLRTGLLQTGNALSIKSPKSVVLKSAQLPSPRGIKPLVTTEPLTEPKATISQGQFATNPSWSQNFATMSNGPLSSSIWDYNLGNGGPDNPGWGNNEEEYYTSSQNNVRISGGQLIIEAEQESDQSDPGFNYTSARIVTTPSLNFTYGKLDIVAKLPAGVGTWPAFWLLPSDGRYAVWNSTTEQDPNNYLKDGEIDIMEATGSIPAQVTSSAQSYVYNPLNNNERVGITNVNDDTTAFHDYELQWTPTSLSFLIDGVAYHTVTKAATDTTNIWPYNQPFYLILNIAMGGTEGGTIQNSSGPWQMAIKSINYYPYTGN